MLWLRARATFSKRPQAPAIRDYVLRDVSAYERRSSLVEYGGGGSGTALLLFYGKGAAGLSLDVHSNSFLDLMLIHSVLFSCGNTVEHAIVSTLSAFFSGINFSCCMLTL